MCGRIMNGGLNTSLAQPIDNGLPIDCGRKHNRHQMMRRWPRIREWHHYRRAMRRNELPIVQRQTSPDVIPFRQSLHLCEADRSSQLVHTVVEPEDRHIVIWTATVEALPRAACHAMRTCSPDGFSQRTAAGNDCASLSGRHVLIAIKAECRRLAKGPGGWQPRRMRGILDQEQPLAASKRLPGVPMRQITAKTHNN